jgi:hypothetical protein
MRPPRPSTTKARILYRGRRKMTRGQCFTIDKVGILGRGWKLSLHEVTSLPPELVTVVETFEIWHVAAASRHRPMAGNLVAGEPGIPSALRAGYVLWSNDAGTFQKRYLSATCLWPRLPESLLICGELSIAQLPSHKTKELGSVAGCHEKSCRVMMSPNRDTTLVGNHDDRRGRKGLAGIAGQQSISPIAAKSAEASKAAGIPHLAGSTLQWQLMASLLVSVTTLAHLGASHVARELSSGVPEGKFEDDMPRDEALRIPGLARETVSHCVKLGAPLPVLLCHRNSKGLVHQGDRPATRSLRWAFMKGSVV